MTPRATAPEVSESVHDLNRFFVIGAGRCGTTSLCDALSQLPAVAMCEPKEPGFFCDQPSFDRGLEWYESLFSVGSETRWLGEGTVNYTNRRHSGETAARLAQAYPQAKLIYITRNPMEQILSNWRFSWMAGSEAQGFSTAIRENPTYLERCDYDWQLAPYRSCFPPQSLWIGFYEEMCANEAVFLESVLRFLGMGGPRAALSRSNTGDSLRRPRALLTRVRSFPGFADLRRWVPTAIRRRVASLLHRRIPWPEDSDWTPELRDWTLARVGDRSRDFLRANQRELSLWNL